MKDTDLGAVLRRAADDLPPADLVGASLRAGERVRVRRRRAAVAGAVALTVAVLAGATWWGGQPAAAPRPVSPGPHGAGTVRLTQLGSGPTPALDLLGHDFVFRTASGRTVPVASPATIDRIGDVMVPGGPDGVVTLHDVDGRFAVGVGAARPVPVVRMLGNEDFRQLLRGPRGTVFLQTTPGRLSSVRTDGTITVVPTRGRSVVAATRDAYWGTWHGRTWRLDPADPAGWTDVGPATELLAMYDADAVWTKGARCTALHDATSYAVLWRSCDLGGAPPTNASVDGRYVLFQRSDHVLEVLAARTGRSVVRLALGRLNAFAGTGSTWSGDRVTFLLSGPGTAGRPRTWATCDVSRRACWRTGIPLDTRWIGPPS